MTRVKRLDAPEVESDHIVEPESEVIRKTLLLVATESAVTEEIDNLLGSTELSGYDFLQVDGTHAALARLQNGGVDLVLLHLDCSPVQADVTVESTIGALCQVPVIAVVEPGSHRVGVEAVRRGAYAYVPRNQVETPLMASTIESAIERHKADLANRAREERLVLAIRGADQGPWDWDLATDKVFYSAGWSSMLGLDEVEVTEGLGRWLERVHPDDVKGVKKAFENHISGRRGQLSCEYRMRCGDGEYRWMLAKAMAVCDAAGRPLRLTGCQVDIDDRKQTEEQILHDAMHDSLTGLPNRAVFIDRVALALARLHRRPEYHFAVLFIDLDHFKRINDTYGHAVGDRILVGVAERIAGFLRPEDTVARLCGDEYAVLLSDVGDVSVAAHVSERMLEAFEEPFTVDDHDVPVGLSIGIAMSATGYGGPHEILHDADVAMYRSKAAGGSRCQIFDAEMHHAAVTLIQMESDLRTAVKQGDFLMHYQPIVSLESARIAGFEGLVRWQHPDKGLLAASQFLAVAAASGLIVPIDWWALEESCRQLYEWQRRIPCEPPLWVSVNVSGRLFTQVNMVPRVLEILESTRLDPDNLRLELSENVVAEHGGDAVARLEELRALGVRLSVDDFGAGFASLSLLDRFKFDSLKIDPECVSHVGDRDHPGTLVETILAMARSLGMGVIAEGIETSTQADSLRRMKCPQGQGFWFSRPLDAEAAVEMLQNRTH